MITLTKDGNAIKFTFDDSQHYLQGDGVIEVPVNSLSLVQDESDMATFKKAASNDIFISATYDELGMTKSELLQWYKTNMVGETGGGGTGSGVTEEEVAEMIGDALEDYYTSDEIDAGFSAVTDEISAAVSGKADTSAVTALDSILTAHTADTGIHVSQQEKNAWNAKAEPYSAGTGIDITDNVISATGGGGGGISSGEVQTMIDQSVSGKVDTSAFTESEQVTATALNDLNERTDTIEQVTAIALNDLNDNKQDTLLYYSEETVEDEITGEYEKTGKIVAGNEDSANFADVFVDFQHTDGGENLPFASLDANTNDGEGYTTMTYVSVDGATAMMFAQEDTDDEGDITTNDANVTVSPTGVGIYVNNQDGTTELSVDGNGAAINGDPIATEGYMDAAISAATSGITGGGATYSAGTNISIDTANTISCTLPLTKGSAYNDSYALYGGDSSTATGMYSFAFGDQTKADRDGSAAFGKANVSNSTGSNYFSGSKSNYLFTVGNGYGNSDRHNALEIRQSGDIYISDVDSSTGQYYYQKPMIRLQDMYAALGGLKFVQCTQNEYSAMVSGGTVDSSTIYFITNVVS